MLFCPKISAAAPQQCSDVSWSSRYVVVISKSKDELIVWVDGKQKYTFSVAATLISNEWLVPIENGYPALEKEYLGLELNKMPMNTTQTEALASIYTRWFRELDTVRTAIQEIKGRSPFDIVYS